MTQPPAEPDHGRLDQHQPVEWGAVYRPRAARERRELMAKVLSGAGLVNYPTEWWHWTYRDRYWALMTDAPAALYGPVLAEPVA